MYTPRSIVLVLPAIIVVSPALGQVCGWELLDDSPPPLSGHAMSADGTSGGVIVLEESMVRPLTWRRSDGRWEVVATMGPTVRSRAVMTRDVVDGAAVLFGGGIGPGPMYSDETWRWDGAAWALLTPKSSPPARSNHAMAFDERRGRVVMFGGWTGVRDSGLWEWDGETWTRIDAAGPSGREAHSMAYDAARGKVVLFGGLTDVVWCSGETWEWDGRRWTLRTTAGPSARAGAAMAYDRLRNVTVLLGGSSCEGGYQRDTWEWDGATWERRSLAGPSTRVMHAMAYDEESGRVVLYGGDAPAQMCDDTWEWDGTRWRRVGGPGDRAGVAMAYDASRERTVMFGSSHDATVYEWDGVRWHAVQTAGGPDPRAPYSMAYDSRNERILLVGQLPWLSEPTMTWAWDGAEWTFLALGGPTPAVQPAMTWDAARDRLVAFIHRTDLTTETWEFDGAVWERREADSIHLPQYSSFVIGYDASRMVSVLQVEDGVNTGSTWEWNGDAWTRRSRALVSGEIMTSKLVYDGAHARLLMIGTLYSGSSATWAWDGATWTELGIDGFPSRFYFGAAYDAARREVLVFGGERACSKPLCGQFSELWRLPTVREACPADWDCSAGVDSGDFFLFLESFFRGGDFNGDGRANSQDFFDYLIAFFGGCR